MKLFQRFARNVHGRDFAVGDIHGCFDHLRAFLHTVHFDESRDRLFTPGDLVDRGEQSDEAIDYLKKPWFFATEGNHERMTIGIAEGRHDFTNYLKNGGAWFLVKENEEQQAIAQALSQMPLAIEVAIEGGTVGIVHAEAPSPWSDLVRLLDHPDQLSKNTLKQLREKLLWSRSRVRTIDHKPKAPDDYDQSPVEGITYVIVGHTVADRPRWLGNSLYLDTGACYGGKLSGINLAKPNEIIQVP